jgi:hypothetical protein
LLKLEGLVTKLLSHFLRRLFENSLLAIVFLMAALSLFRAHWEKQLLNLRQKRLLLTLATTLTLAREFGKCLRPAQALLDMPT